MQSIALGEEGEPVLANVECGFCSLIALDSSNRDMASFIGIIFGGKKSIMV